MFKSLSIALAALAGSLQTKLSMPMPETTGKFNYLEVSKDRGHRLSGKFKIGD